MPWKGFSPESPNSHIERPSSRRAPKIGAGHYSSLSSIPKNPSSTHSSSAWSPATAPAYPPERQYDFSQSEVPAGAPESEMTPVPASQEAPPESVPDVTPPPAASDTGEWHAEPAEPETMEMDQQAAPQAERAYTTPPAEPAFSVAPPGFSGALGLTPAPEIGAGEVEQRPAGASAASLLASLQRPVPKLESEAAAPPPAETGVPPAPPAVTEEHAEPSLVSKETEGEHEAAEVEQKDVKPITRVRCAGCKAAIPVFSAQRPLVVTCPQCGRMGMLK